MTDVIDRVKLLATLHASLATAISRHDGGDYEDEIRYAIRAVEGAEGVDAVGIVRCRDCAICNTPNCGMADWRYETGRWVKHDNWNTDDDFCSDGERKEEHNGEAL